jgi:hypothetical protein
VDYYYAKEKFGSKGTLHKNKDLFACDFEFCTVSLLVMLKYYGFVKKAFLIGPLIGEIRLFRLQ